MMDWDLSVVVITPASFREKANALACALGYDELPGSTFSVPLSPDGQEPATHYGCRTAAKPEFIAILNAARDGNLPDLPWNEYGITPQDPLDVLAAVHIDDKPASFETSHFPSVLATKELFRIEVTE